MAKDKHIEDNFAMFSPFRFIGYLPITMYYFTLFCKKVVAFGATNRPLTIFLP